MPLNFECCVGSEPRNEWGSVPFNVHGPVSKSYRRPPVWLRVGSQKNKAAVEIQLIPTPQPVNDRSLPVLIKPVRDPVPPDVPIDLRELGEVVHHETPGYKPLTTQ